MYNPRSLNTIKKHTTSSKRCSFIANSNGYFYSISILKVPTIKILVTFCYSKYWIFWINLINSQKGLLWWFNAIIKTYNLVKWILNVLIKDSQAFLSHISKVKIGISSMNLLFSLFVKTSFREFTFFFFTSFTLLSTANIALFICWLSTGRFCTFAFIALTNLFSISISTTRIVCNHTWRTEIRIF